MTSGPEKLERQQLEGASEELGFRAEPLEKLLRLITLLDGLHSHPYLQPRLALKGGTALNLFVLDLPRLSVDVDLNYVGAIERETMLDERPQVERAVRAVCERQGFRVLRVPGEHAGGKWRLGYNRVGGGAGTLEIDLNFLLRIPLWPASSLDAPTLLGFTAQAIPVLDLHELAGGKLAALFSRSASRDFYDVVRILEQPTLNRSRLRLAFLTYGAMSRRDWREISLDEIGIEARDAGSQLLPLLRADLAPDPAEVEPWCREMVERCRERLSAVLPFEAHEIEFLELVNEEGVIRPELLTDDPELQRRIRMHPALRWKALNARRHRGKNRVG